MLTLLLQDPSAVGTLLLATTDTSGISIFRFFAGMFLILTFYIGALLFTYWISKGE